MVHARRFLPLCRWLLILALATPAVAPAQTAASPPPAAPTATPAPPPDRLLDYENALLKRSADFENFLSDQTKDHRASLEDIYSKIIWLAGAAITIFGSVITVYNAIILKGVKRRVTEKFSDEIDKLVREKSRRFQSELDANATSAAEQVAKLKLQTDEQLRLAQQTSLQSFNTSVDYASVIAWAAVVLNFEPTNDPQRQASNDRQRAAVIERMETLQGKVPRGRTFNIFLGRLHRAGHRLDLAIRVLDEVLKHYDPALPNHQSDCAAFLYNRACYQTLLASQFVRENRPPAESKLLFDHAWRDLLTVVKISPKDRVEAIADPDFDGLIGSDPARQSWDQLTSP